ncbi:MAG: helix-turn-helix transcriptional regulator [Syntrophaceae bacterium]
MKKKSKNGSQKSDMNHVQSSEAHTRIGELSKDIMDRLNDGVYWLNRDGYFVFVNKAITDISKIPADNFYALHFLDVVDVDYHKTAKKNFQHVMNGNDGIPYELKYEEPTGQIRIVEIRSAPVFDDGKVTGVLGISRDITERKKMEESLQQAHRDLERLENERASQFMLKKRNLIEEIARRKRAEKEFKKKERDLEEKTRALKESQTALKVLLKQREIDKIDIEKWILSNVRDIIMPYVEKLKKITADAEATKYINILESNLKGITASFSHRASPKNLNLTPREMVIANFIKEGKNSKEIGRLMNISERTVDYHRENMRRKLGIQNKRTDLRTYLLNLR